MLSDLVDYTYYNEQRCRLLHFCGDNEVGASSPSYVHVAKKVIESINIELFVLESLKLSEYTTTTASDSDIICELHFRKS